MGKEMVVNEPLTGLGWRVKYDGCFLVKMSINEPKIIHK